MAYIILKTGEYEFGSMHIESQLDPHDNSKNSGPQIFHRSPDARQRSVYS